MRVVMADSPEKREIRLYTEPGFKELLAALASVLNGGATVRVQATQLVVTGRLRESEVGFQVMMSAAGVAEINAAATATLFGVVLQRLQEVLAQPDLRYELDPDADTINMISTAVSGRILVERIIAIGMTLVHEGEDTLPATTVTPS